MFKRYNSLMLAFIFMFTVLAGRCGYIALSKSYTVSDGYNSYKITIGERYTNIYDRAGMRLNNNFTERVAVIPADENALIELDKLFEKDEEVEIRQELAQGYPVKRVTDKKVNTKNIHQYNRIVENYDNMPARHLLDKACGGLEYYTDKKIGELSVNFAMDARGRLLNGDCITLRNDNYDSGEGIVISLDSKVQQLAQQAAKSIDKGAVVVMDVNTSQVLASVSLGDDYINRATSSYSVGSIFKLVVSACALENNINPHYICTSSITVGDTTFSCQKNHSHGLQNMRSALANSCNCYFVNLALSLGADKLYKTASELGFGAEYELYDNWTLKSGIFPTIDEMNYSSGQLALIGFGQGKLTDSPMHFASVISCIARGGEYTAPTLDIVESDSSRVLSNDTCKTLCEYMHNVVESGTGANAQFNGKTAGKTATAQSGIFIDGKEILNTWFAGFYPYDNPEYAIVVMQENGTSGAENCCPVFRTIVENFDEL